MSDTYRESPVCLGNDSGHHAMRWAGTRCYYCSVEFMWVEVVEHNAEWVEARMDIHLGFFQRIKTAWDLLRSGTMSVRFSWRAQDTVIMDAPSLIIGADHE